MTAGGATIDAGGGAAVDGGATVTVPAGSLPPGAILTVSILPGAPADARAPSGARFLDTTIELTTSAPLAEPAAIRFNIAPDNDPALVGAGLINNGAVEVLPVRVVDGQAGVIEIIVTHFSRFALFMVTGPGPALTGPATGARLPGLGADLSWSNPRGAVQYQVEVVPFGNDGPGINLVRNVADNYRVEAPVFGSGNYVMLPDETYLWRVRTSVVTRPPEELTEADWDAWSASWFHTASRDSSGIASATGASLPIWTNADNDVFYYEIQVSPLPDFGPDAFLYWELRHGGATQPLNSYRPPPEFPLRAGITYYWRVRPRVQGDGAPVAWSPVWSFIAPLR